MKIWLDGAWQNGPGTWPLDDRGLLFGEHIFETLRVDNGVAHFVAEHRERLRSGLALLGIDGLRFFDRIVRDIPRAPRAASLRISITAGSGPTLAERSGRARAFALLRPRPRPRESLRVSLARGRKGSAIPAQLKHANYLGELLARRAAVGFDDVIMRNAPGRPCELTAANLFAVDRGVVLTPPLSEGVLPGITRAVVIGLARAHGFEVREQRFTTRTLAADELFATSTLLGVCPIVQIDQRLLAVGRVTVALQQAYVAVLSSAIAAKDDSL